MCAQGYERVTPRAVHASFESKRIFCNKAPSALPIEKAATGAAMTSNPVEIGQQVPPFTSESTSGPFALADQAGRKVVLYFYPKDSTPGCTTETQEFGDTSPAFGAAGAVVFGISRGSIKSH